MTGDRFLRLEASGILDFEFHLEIQTLNLIRANQCLDVFLRIKKRNDIIFGFGTVRVHTASV
jgi:hypothetical protein